MSLRDNEMTGVRLSVRQEMGEEKDQIGLKMRTFENRTKSVEGRGENKHQKSNGMDGQFTPTKNNPAGLNKHTVRGTDANEGECRKITQNNTKQHNETVSNAGRPNTDSTTFGDLRWRQAETVR